MYIDCKNSQIHYTVDGKGESIVLLHGFLETTAMWNHLIPKFSKTHQVICIDLLGHGKTGCLGYIHTMEEMAEAVFSVLNHLNIVSANFVGHSMGGYVALALAEKHPDLFTSLCLMNSTFEADDENKKALRTRANKMAQTNFINLVRMSFENLFAVESKIKFKNEFSEALQIALQIPVQGYIAASEGMKVRPDRFEVFKHLDAKKLVIIGKKDTLINGNRLISKVKSTPIDYVEFSEGHMSHIENKSELTDILIQLIEK
ncbi:alpha/beta fold hydrolase [Winogradskyella bathintestinalis]|uniref:Alpha/beta hydrolase n=1 Tax=Winogradskyella bathintestinalis TaxID=3035208 RepID=A0ABT7ZQY1_9FLAO|nr:alpha/beta hydrolase [Winogradskyella bathintestinalis]MDN3491415.1 alpha/beta hydrolase [Winogradskyella bathintestinalis]